MADSNNLNPEGRRQEMERIRRRNREQIRNDRNASNEANGRTEGQQRVPTFGRRLADIFNFTGPNLPGPSVTNNHETPFINEVLRNYELNSNLRRGEGADNSNNPVPQTNVERMAFLESRRQRLMADGPGSLFPDILSSGGASQPRTGDQTSHPRTGAQNSQSQTGAQTETRHRISHTIIGQSSNARQRLAEAMNNNEDSIVMTFQFLVPDGQGAPRQLGFPMFGFPPGFGGRGPPHQRRPNRPNSNNPRENELFELFEQQAQLIAAAAFHDWLFSHGEEHLQGQPPASERAINRLQVFKVLSEKRLAKHVNCAICQEDFPTELKLQEFKNRVKQKVEHTKEEELVHEELLRMPCGHFYHRTCISTWLHQSATCPACRYEVFEIN
jgi:hypothetical protein